MRSNGSFDPPARASTQFTDAVGEDGGWAWLGGFAFAMLGGAVVGIECRALSLMGSRCPMCWVSLLGFGIPYLPCVSGNERAREARVDEGLKLEVESASER